MHAGAVGAACTLSAFSLLISESVRKGKKGVLRAGLEGEELQIAQGGELRGARVALQDGVPRGAPPTELGMPGPDVHAPTLRCKRARPGEAGTYPGIREKMSGSLDNLDSSSIL